MQIDGRSRYNQTVLTVKYSAADQTQATVPLTRIDAIGPQRPGETAAHWILGTSPQDDRVVVIVVPYLWG